MIWPASIYIEWDCELSGVGPFLFSFIVERVKLGPSSWWDNEWSGVEIQDEKAQDLPDKNGLICLGPRPSPNPSRQKSTTYGPAEERLKGGEEKVLQYESTQSLWLQMWKPRLHESEHWKWVQSRMLRVVKGELGGGFKCLNKVAHSLWG